MLCALRVEALTATEYTEPLLERLPLFGVAKLRAFSSDWFHELHRHSL